MALNLNLPTLKSKPAIIAETRPQKIKAYITNLRAHNALEMASYLHSELETLNRQKVSPANRVQALDTYRSFVMNTAQALAESYSDVTLPLAQNAKFAANAAESLWLEFGYGYKLALVDLQNQLIKMGDKSAHCIQRAMQAIGGYTMVHYQTYLTPPSHVWSDLHQLYFCAVQLGVEKIGIKDVKFAISIESTYKKALLMSLADTQQLTPLQMQHVAEILSQHVSETFISSVAPLDTSAAAFIINLKSDNPPEPYSKQKVAPDPVTDILLLTIDLVRALHIQFSRLHNNQLVSASRDNEMDLLTYLIQHWGVIPKRLFRRLAKNGDLEIVTGISAIHRAIYHQTEGQNAAEQMITPSFWQILNFSATGMSIRRHSTAEKNIKIGSLLGIKAKDNTQWTLGVVRWASCGSNDKLDIGVQFISPETLSATARIDHRDFDEPVLIIPENLATKQAVSLVVPKGTFAPARQVAIRYQHYVKHAMLTKLISRSPYYEQVQYSVID